MNTQKNEINRRHKIGMHFLDNLPNYMLGGLVGIFVLGYFLPDVKTGSVETQQRFMDSITVYEQKADVYFQQAAPFIEKVKDFQDSLKIAQADTLDYGYFMVILGKTRDER